MRLVGRLAIGSVHMFVLAACTSTVSGTPRTPRNSVHTMLGDLTTIDACGLTDPELFAEFGAPEFFLDDTSFEECTVHIPFGDEELISVRTGELERFFVMDDIEIDRELPGGLRVGTVDDDDTNCERVLLFADDVALFVRAWISAENPPAPACEIADIGMDNVIRVVQAGQVPHRDYPPNSFALIEPCAVTPPRTLDDQPAYSSLEPVPQLQEHSCWWFPAKSGSAPYYATLAFHASPPLAETYQQELIEIYDRSSALDRSSSDTSDWCMISTEHIPYPVEWRSGVVEWATVTVAGPTGSMDEACAAAYALAERAFPRLPTP